MTMTTYMAPGFYGKMMSHGDFVSRRLPDSFIEPWDSWMQSSIAASREQLSSDWLDIFLTSPIWRFVLTPKICGDKGWVGVFMPSADRVGRCYPLVVASSIESCGSSICLISTADEWFEKIEEATLNTLEDDFDLECLDKALQGLTVPDTISRDPNGSVYEHSGNQSSRKAFIVNLEEPPLLNNSFFGLTECLLKEVFVSYSLLWTTSGSEYVRPSLIACDGLPPIDTFVAFLNGQWEQHGWDLQRCRTYVSTVKPTASDSEPLVEIDPATTACGTLGLTDPGVKFSWESCGITDVGKQREINEDAYLDRADIGLWAVADGMGGHCAGEVASRMIIDALSKTLSPSDLESFVCLVDDSLQKVNRDLVRLAAEKHKNQVVGSTVVVFLISGNRCAFIWAGDSRLYRYRDRKLIQLTHDHSVFNEGIEPDSLLSAAELEVSNIITRAVGAENVLSLDSGIEELQDGDVFLLCSDGLTKEVSPVEIATIIDQVSAESASQSLIDLALQRGAIDNVTALVVDIHQ